MLQLSLSSFLPLTLISSEHYYWFLSVICLFLQILCPCSVSSLCSSSNRILRLSIKVLLSFCYLMSLAAVFTSHLLWCFFFLNLLPWVACHLLSAVAALTVLGFCFLLVPEHPVSVAFTFLCLLFHFPALLTLTFNILCWWLPRRSILFPFHSRFFSCSLTPRCLPQVDLCQQGCQRSATSHFLLTFTISPRIGCFLEAPLRILRLPVI